MSHESPASEAPALPLPWAVKRRTPAHRQAAEQAPKHPPTNIVYPSSKDT
jgi:hypothetical protein